MKSMRLILKDQLSESISSLENYDSEKDIILMCEVWDEFTDIKLHKKKIAFLLSAMRHFAESLKSKGYHNIIYIKLDDIKAPKKLKDLVRKQIEINNFKRIIVTEPSEYKILNDIKKWQFEFDIPIEIKSDNRFLCSIKDFSEWAENRKNLRMEYFYREMRKKYNILMAKKNPVGGKWNYDTDNRKKPKDNLDFPVIYSGKIDQITKNVINFVAQNFSNHFGDLKPFYFAVTRSDALEALKSFIKYRLLFFGDYQDAMIQDQPWMFHSHISFYLNCGLLLPLECIKVVENAYIKGEAPLNSVEGFIRQIIGWREYIRGIYWLKMPDYEAMNFFNAKLKLPKFYWNADTKMNCLRQCILETKKHAYAHHIQRLMVLGNFALLCGINPKYVNEWFLIVYADAYQWVELPNVSGMVLFADGGYLASKPYASGGSYINKMSNYCKNCSYKVTKKNGPDACPFNYLYWDFLERNREKLVSNHRIGMMYKIFDRMGKEKQKAIRDDSHKFFRKVENDILV